MKNISKKKKNISKKKGIFFLESKDYKIKYRGIDCNKSISDE